MYRTKIDSTGSTIGTDAAVEHLLERMSSACTTCDDFACLDCVDGTEHTACTRACPACSTAADSAAVDWDQAWETTTIITELRGLERVDEAIRNL